MADHSYQTLVEGLLAAQLDEPQEWGTLLTRLPGIYPAIVHNTVLRLGLSTRVRYGTDGRTSVARSAVRGWENRLLPTPHMADATWWFTDSTIANLLEQVESYSAPGDKILFLGTPTLYLGAEASISDRKITLMDRNTRLPSRQDGRTTVVAADVLGNSLLPSEPASVVVVDPPWYVPEMIAFLRAARRYSREGTRILLSAPPIGTRPGIPEQWAEVLAWCRAAGLDLRAVRAGELSYVMPPFEWNSLRAGHVPDCPLDWRRGDLVVFVCRECQSFDDLAQGLPPASQWSEVTVGRVRIRLRADTSLAAGPPALVELVEGDVLPTVSRRAQALGKAKIWTSGNRVFGCRNGAVIREVLAALASGLDPLRVVRNLARSPLGREYAGCVESVADKLEGIVRCEEMELSDWNRRVTNDLVQLAS